MIFKPKVYQDFSIKHLIENPAAGLLQEMGLGKTVSTATSIDTLIYDMLEVSKVLVIAPKKVADHTWEEEIQKWDHLKHLKLSKILGSAVQRKKALAVKADIYTINCENLVWLISHLGGAWPFDMVVIDESTKFKNSQSARFKALRMVRPKAKRVVILTGTPVPNGLLDLWPQMYLLDQGQRLGKTLTGYRDKYFNAGNRNGHVVFDYKLRKEGVESLLGEDIYEQEIYDKIGDICISMKAEDWLDLPPLIETDIPIYLPPAIQQQYNEFEKSQVLALTETENISAINAAALTGKLLQFANGAVYRPDKTFYEVHNEKLEKLEEDLEALNGQPLLVFYTFKSDLERIKTKLKSFRPRELKGTADINDWNAGKAPFMLAHPASAGHGLNLQEGGHHGLWFGNDWNLEYYLQARKRLHRPGQSYSVFLRRYVTVGTIEERVIGALSLKENKQQALMNAVKAVVNKYR